MATNKLIRKRIRALKKEFDERRAGKDALLAVIDEAELPEAVYNSNAIENSTLSLSDTERILLEAEASVDASPREIFEAKNLARVSAYTITNKPFHSLTIFCILGRICPTSRSLRTTPSTSF